MTVSMYASFPLSCSKNLGEMGEVKYCNSSCFSYNILGYDLDLKSLKLGPMNLLRKFFTTNLKIPLFAAYNEDLLPYLDFISEGSLRIVNTSSDESSLGPINYPIIIDQEAPDANAFRSIYDQLMVRIFNKRLEKSSVEELLSESDFDSESKTYLRPLDYKKNETCHSANGVILYTFEGIFQKSDLLDLVEAI
ncbi:hypothetical protein Ciccas_002652, partial [Cichlidogyrus casuarinus]